MASSKEALLFRDAIIAIASSAVLLFKIIASIMLCVALGQPAKKLSISIGELGFWAIGSNAAGSKLFNVPCAAVRTSSSGS